jgi:hypothetical protein
MFDRHFFTSKLGLAALVSVVMMVTFNVYALNAQFLASPSAAESHETGTGVGLPLVVFA